MNRFKAVILILIGIVSLFTINDISIWINLSENITKQIKKMIKEEELLNISTLNGSFTMYNQSFPINKDN